MPEEAFRPAVPLILSCLPVTLSRSTRAAWGNQSRQAQEYRFLDWNLSGENRGRAEWHMLVSSKPENVPPLHRKDGKVAWHDRAPKDYTSEAMSHVPTENAVCARRSRALRVASCYFSGCNRHLNVQRQTDTSPRYGHINGS